MGWLATALVLSCLVGAGIVGFAFYKYRLRVRIWDDRLLLDQKI